MVSFLILINKILNGYTLDHILVEVVVGIMVVKDSVVVPRLLSMKEKILQLY